MLRLAAWLLALLVGGFVAFNHLFLRLWVGERFYAGTAVNLLLIAAFLVSVSSSMLSNLCFTAGKIRETSLAGLAQTLVYLPLLWFGGRWFGMRGLVGASLLSVAVTQGWYMPRTFVRIYGIANHDRGRFLRTMLLAGVAAAISAALFRHARPATWVMFAASVAAFCACYGLLLLVLCGAAREETRNGWLWIRRHLSR
jgi:O-antigen/teichoic acid export membrane protein